MRVVIRNPRRREMELAGRRLVQVLLRDLGLDPESHIVVRAGDLLTPDEWLEEDDVVEVVSAISGGLV